MLGDKALQCPAFDVPDFSGAVGSSMASMAVLPVSGQRQHSEGCVTPPKPDLSHTPSLSCEQSILPVSARCSSQRAGTLRTTFKPAAAFVELGPGMDAGLETQAMQLKAACCRLMGPLVYLHAVPLLLLVPPKRLVSLCPFLKLCILTTSLLLTSMVPGNALSWLIAHLCPPCCDGHALLTMNN